ncbi:putative ribose/galactose/methyl galactoside import ATP-binding protein 1 [Synergistales bacterium]|nr:putative ribose/galactose/methyl galactoside import ATP-binding protein 1 [Synergistales bacterium]
MSDETKNSGNILEMKAISKFFFGNRALENVHLEIKYGEVHALIGENGAGKSTLMKILSGAYEKDSGEIIFEGNKVEISTPQDSQKLGVSIIYQEFNLIRGMSVSENMFLGREPCNALGLIDSRKRNSDTQIWLDKVSVKFKPTDLVQDLSSAQAQFVAIASALSKGARLIVMDEPTASLTNKETETLFKLIADLKEQGIAIIFISHHLDEIFEICDSVTVLRDGLYVDTRPIADIDKETLIRMMVGRELSKEFPPRLTTPGESVLNVSGMSRRGVLKNIDFTLRKGEILGIYGLVGSGRTEMVRALYGADRRDRGAGLLLYGKPIDIRSPREGISRGLGFLPEERKQQGVILGMSVANNVTLAAMEKITRHAVLNEKEELEQTEKFVRSLNIKTPSVHTVVQTLSGGNQQKVVVAKCIFTDASVLIFDEPTRGIDVGAKYEIYLLMNELTQLGKSIIMISSDLPEIIGMSDRVLVMWEGRLTGEFDKAKAPLEQESIMKAAAGEVAA